jgi:hypothetical protein
MKKVAAERYRDIDFSRARRGAVIKPEPGKTKVAVRQVVREELAPYGDGRASNSRHQRARSARR